MYGISTDKPSPVRGDGQRVLIVDHDPGTVELLSTTMELAGYQVGTAGTGAEALERLARERFSLVVLDTMLPDLNALTVHSRLAPADRPPVLFLTASDSLGILLPGLGPGADDYVTKPFRIAEVLARAEVLMRGRAPGRRERTPGYGDLFLEDATRQARRGERLLDLTPAEYRLLRYLLMNAEQVFSKRQISRRVWGEVRADNAIEKLVSRLRCKVDLEGPELIHTRRGFGYWLGRV